MSEALEYGYAPDHEVEQTQYDPILVEYGVSSEYATQVINHAVWSAHPYDAGDFSPYRGTPDGDAINGAIQSSRRMGEAEAMGYGKVPPYFYNMGERRVVQESLNTYEAARASERKAGDPQSERQYQGWVNAINAARRYADLHGPTS